MKKYKKRSKYSLIITGDNYEYLEEIALEFRNIRSKKKGYYSQIFENDFMAKNSEARETALTEAKAIIQD